MAYVPAVLMTVGIAVVSLWEAPHLPPPVMSLGDKVLHGFMYTVLAVCWAVPLTLKRPQTISNYLKPAIWVCLCVTAYGALMEVLQRYCTLTRSGEMADVLADFIGALLGVALVAMFTWLHPKNKCLNGK